VFPLSDFNAPVGGVQGHRNAQRFNYSFLMQIMHHGCWYIPHMRYARTHGERAVGRMLVRPYARIT
jgi:hypothetical protein